MEDLAFAFIESAREFRGNELDFRAAWSELGLQVARAPVGKLTWQEWRRLDEAMSAKNYPAIHHSAAYTKARKPAYRVITQAAAGKLRKTLEDASESDRN